MAIKNLSDKRTLPRVGKIHLGVKKQKAGSSTTYPEATDYFVVRADEKSTSPEAAAAFKKVYGDKPKVLDIMFPSDDPEVFFPQNLKAYKTSALFCKGDGEKAQRQMEDGAYKDWHCDPSTCEYKKNNKCKEMGNLMVLLPKVPGLGVWQLDTSSINSIINMNSTLDFLRGQTGGKLANIPLKLTLLPKDVKAGSMKKKIYILGLNLEGLASELKPVSNQINEFDASYADERSDDHFPDNANALVEEPTGSYPIDEDDVDAAQDEYYSILEIGSITGKKETKPALKLQRSGQSPFTAILNCTIGGLKTGMKISAEIKPEKKGDKTYYFIDNYKVA